MERLKFQFEVVPAEDQKSNVIAITSITNEKEIKFQIPSNLWPIKHHAELTALPEFKKVITTLKKRGHTRNVWFNLSEQVLSKYKDESGNMAIGDYLLEESQTSQKQQITAQTTKIDENLLRILEKFSEHKEDNQTLKNRNLSKISEKFVIEKFNGLPAFVRDKIDREDLENSEDLFNELRRYEKTTNRRIIEDNKDARRITKPETRSSDKKPCKICEEKGKNNRYHPENLCWYKAERNRTQNRNISTNSILEVELNTEDQKN
ncbi:uncharacterized protein LOC143215622 isoform X1 [Lasioglossum baleicum]|uniref:uncharacterized protein LOC143215622 isoform X1 n=1 Tax=Lasioglossum baleicum TaxID=434251 RepID=UPI003FCCFBCB